MEWIKEKENILRKRINEFKSAKEIADELGISEEAVQSKAQRLKLYFKNAFWEKDNGKNEKILRKLIEKRLSQKEVAKELGTTKGAVKEKARKLRLHFKSKNAFWEKDNGKNEKILRKRIKEFKSSKEIADELDTTEKAVRVRAHKLRLHFKSKNAFWEKDNGKNEKILRKRIKEFKSSKEIADELDTTEVAVRERARKLGIYRSTRFWKKDNGKNEKILRKRIKEFKSSKEIADELDTTEVAVRERARKLRLHFKSKNAFWEKDNGKNEKELCKLVKSKKFSLKEIAEKLGTTVGAVEARMYALKLCLPQKGPNNKELELQNCVLNPICRELHLDDFIFTGKDYKNAIGEDKDKRRKRRPDFRHFGLNLLIEYNGIYHHLKKLHLKDTPANRKKAEKERIAFFRKYGFKTLIIWGDELKDKEKLKRKVTRWLKRYI